MKIDTFSKNLSENMLLNRKRSRLTQKELADQLGISRTYYSEIENNKAVPSLEVFLRIEAMFPFFLKTNDADNNIYGHGGEQHVIKDSAGRHIGK